MGGSQDAPQRSFVFEIPGWADAGQHGGGHIAEEKNRVFALAGKVLCNPCGDCGLATAGAAPDCQHAPLVLLLIFLVVIFIARRTGEDASFLEIQHHATFPYLQTEDAQGVVLPYNDGRLAFFALMPQEGTNFEGWLGALDGEAFSQLLEGRTDTEFLTLALPKFEAEWSSQLQDILSALGLDLAFTFGKADFSLLGDDPNGYFLSQVIHAAKIEVNERGTEAAAATVVEANAGSALPPETGVTLIFDRPFQYGIVDLETGLPLFLGTFE